MLLCGDRLARSEASCRIVVFKVVLLCVLESTHENVAVEGYRAE